ncbi:hypothetical protein QP185_07850 [Sphingomonas aerolata]|uniref:hypothetical protein n=1 Tax=Sphingomonas aerolata TaxID=185951 RepID=UPI002FDF2E7B
MFWTACGALPPLAVLVMHVTPYNAILITLHAALAVDFFFGLRRFRDRVRL